MVLSAVLGSGPASALPATSSSPSTGPFSTGLLFFLDLLALHLKIVYFVLVLFVGAPPKRISSTLVSSLKQFQLIISSSHSTHQGEP